MMDVCKKMYHAVVGGGEEVGGERVDESHGLEDSISENLEEED